MGISDSRYLLEVRVGQETMHYDLADGSSVLPSEMSDDDMIVGTPLRYEVDEDGDEWVHAGHHRLGLTPELAAAFDAIARETGRNLFVQYRDDPEPENVVPEVVGRLERIAEAATTRPFRNIAGLVGPCTVTYWREFGITGRPPLRLMLLGECHISCWEHLTTPRSGPGIALYFETSGLHKINVS